MNSIFKNMFKKDGKKVTLESGIKHTEMKKETITGLTLISDGKINEQETIMDEKIEGCAAVPQKQYSNLVVVLDPGHAKSTPGKKSPYSLGKVSTPELPLEEWQFSRNIADRVAFELRKYGVDVFITTDSERDGDTDLGLSKRAERANNYVKKSGKKGVLISIHADADGDGSKWTSAHGWSAFTTKGQNNSDKLADCLYDAAEEMLGKECGLRIRTDKSDGDRDWEQDFTVLYKSAVPAVLTENLFYTNIQDCEFLNSGDGKEVIANVHVNGILKFADTVYKM